MKVPPDGFGGFAGNDGGERLGRSLLHVAQAAEVGEQALARELEVLEVQYQFLKSCQSRAYERTRWRSHK